MVSLMRLPGYEYADNALLKLGPINDAIDTKIRKDEADRRFGLDEQRLDLAKAASGREAEQHRETMRKAYAQRLAGVAQMIEQDPDTNSRSAKWQRVLAADPKMAAALPEHVRDPINGPKFLLAETRDALEDKAKRASIAATEATTALNTAKLPDAQDPTLAYNRRGEMAAKYGLQPGTREYNEFVLTGDFPRLATQQQTPDMQAQARRRAVIEQGGNPEDPHTKQFILTGKFPREDQAPLTATDKKAILEADDAVRTNREVLTALGQAKEINARGLPPDKDGRQSDPAVRAAAPNSGAGASGRAWLGNNLPDWMVPDRISSPESSKATLDYENLVLGQALASLKSTFGAAPTEGERQILLELQASVSKPPEVRKQILDRAIALAEARLTFNQQRANDIRGGIYYKPQQPGVTNGPVVSDGTPKQFNDRVPQQGAQGQIPPAAVQFLRQHGNDPGIVQQFEQKYGAGSAQQFLMVR